MPGAWLEAPEKPLPDRSEGSEPRGERDAPKGAPGGKNVRRPLHPPLARRTPGTRLPRRRGARPETQPGRDPVPPRAGGLSRRQVLRGRRAAGGRLEALSEERGPRDAPGLVGAGDVP